MEFWRGLEDARNDRIYSSGNRGVKKGPGPRGTRDEEFLVPSLLRNRRRAGRNVGHGKFGKNNKRRVLNKRRARKS